MITPDERNLLVRADRVMAAADERGLSADEVWGDMVDRIEAAGVASSDDLDLIAACGPARIRSLLLRLERAA